MLKIYECTKKKLKLSFIDFFDRMECGVCWISVLTAVAVLVLICFSHSARYHLKFWSYSIGSILAAILPIPLFILRPRDYRNAL